MTADAPDFSREMRCFFSLTKVMSPFLAWSNPAKPVIRTERSPSMGHFTFPASSAKLKDGDCLSDCFFMLAFVEDGGKFRSPEKYTEGNSDPQQEKNDGSQGTLHEAMKNDADD